MLADLHDFADLRHNAHMIASNANPYTVAAVLVTTGHPYLAILLAALALFQASRSNSRSKPKALSCRVAVVWIDARRIGIRNTHTTNPE